MCQVLCLLPSLDTQVGQGGAVVPAIMCIRPWLSLGLKHRVDTYSPVGCEICDSKDIILRTELWTTSSATVQSWRLCWNSHVCRCSSWNLWKNCLGSKSVNFSFREARFPNIGQDRKGGQDVKPVGWETEENSCMIQLKHVEEKTDKRFIHVFNIGLQPQKQIS